MPEAVVVKASNDERLASGLAKTERLAKRRKMHLEEEEKKRNWRLPVDHKKGPEVSQMCERGDCKTQ